MCKICNYYYEEGIKENPRLSSLITLDEQITHQGGTGYIIFLHLHDRNFLIARSEGNALKFIISITIILLIL